MDELIRQHPFSVSTETNTIWMGAQLNERTGPCLGGEAIGQTQLQSIMNVLDFGLSIQERITIALG